MSADRNPHAEQMADESMIRTLAAQVSAIWPQEEPLFGRYGLRPDCHIADIGCGSGEITSRLALMYARADVIGIDILASPIACALRRYAFLRPRLHFEQGDAFELRFERTSHFALSVVRTEQIAARPKKVTQK